MPEKDVVTACVLVIGNEILSGRTQDKNINFLAKGLNDIGVRLQEVRVIPDIRDTIITTLNECRAAFDYVITTGGIGPTHDDITSECVAAAFGVGMFRDQSVVDLLQSYMKNTPLNEARLRMATFPEGAELVHNPVSAAPGYRLDNVFVFAGVPQIMQAMFDGAKNQMIGGAIMLSRSVSVELGEGTIAPGLSELQDRYPEIDIGSYPAMRQQRFGVSVVMRGTDSDMLDAALVELKDMLTALGGEPKDESIADPAAASPGADS
ncbi:MAG: competence/damage-inducible protein A [Rhodospirillales bacterium]|nr:competence/damage-inducible protein A [Rhodospirillales bacterium]